MGVLAHVSAHVGPSAQSPIDTSGNFPARMSAESPSNISPNPSGVISQVSRSLSWIYLILANFFSQNRLNWGGGGGPPIFFNSDPFYENFKIQVLKRFRLFLRNHLSLRPVPICKTNRRTSPFCTFKAHQQ